jgi:hypothetical protein
VNCLVQVIVLYLEEWQKGQLPLKQGRGQKDDGSAQHSQQGIL